MRVSVVITTYSRPDDLLECVRSLLTQFEQPDEVIIIDDGDTEQTETRLRDAGVYQDVEHVSGPEKNLPAARNAGVDTATGDVVCFVDDDVVLPPTWLGELVDTYRRGEDVAGVGGYVLNFNPENINKANVDSFGYRALTGLRQIFFTDRIGEISPVGILWAPHIFMRSVEGTTQTLQGCNMSFRREVFETHSFDEWFGTSGSSACEELDFCDRATASGHQLVYNPRAVVLHKRTVNGDRQAGPNYANITNLAYFILGSESLNLWNFLMFTIVITMYAVLKRDAGYIQGLVRGIGSHLRHYTDSENAEDHG